jgi:hypothetical protein
MCMNMRHHESNYMALWQMMPLNIGMRLVLSENAATLTSECSNVERP